MERYFSKIIGTPVYDEGIRPITSVKDLVIDPENGKVVALVVNLSRNLVVAPMDIVSWYEGIKINSSDDIVEGDDILRVQSIQQRGIRIFRNKVETKDGKYLGKVFDYGLEPKSLILSKLFVAKDILGLLRYDSRVIGYNSILEILPDKIVVKSDLATVKVERVKQLEDAAAI